MKQTKGDMRNTKTGPSGLCRTMSRLRVLELFAGIGGCSAALAEGAEIAAAIDINRQALAVYTRNFSHPTAIRAIESLPTEELSQWGADLWWLSPPCQPYTVRGHRRDIDDPRAAGLLNVIRALAEVRPRYVAVENVPGFEASRARTVLIDTLDRGGYTVRETLLCPTQLGVPNRRRRYYLVAARGQLCPWAALPRERGLAFAVADVLDAEQRPELRVSSELIAAYRGAVHVVDPADMTAVSCCFTSAYGKSIACSGSFLKCGDGFRRFSPGEILRLLRFPSRFQLPQAAPERLWPLIGNSLSITAVRYVLSAVPELNQAASAVEARAVETRPVSEGRATLEIPT
jgi:site-specific DNA-cytosine methylase